MRSLIPTLALGLGLVAFATSPASAADGLAVGKPAPAFALTTLAGKHIDLATYRGSTLVINVWGSWCPPCRIETPDLVAAAKKLAPARVAFLGIDTTETVETARAFVAAKGVTYPQVVTTTNSAFAHDYDIRNYPTTIVVDPKGIVRAIHADNLLPQAQLLAYVAAARHGKSALLMTDEQRRLDALLAPEKYSFAGEPVAIVASVRAAAAAIAKADDELDDAMIDPQRDHDLLRTRREQAALRDAAIAALAPIATMQDDKALLARLRGDQLTYAGKWAEASAAYGDALALDATDAAALSGRAYTAGQMNDLAAVIDADTALTRVAPSAGTFVALGRAQARKGLAAESDASFDQAERLAATSPGTLARAELYGARAALMVGETARAKAQYGLAAVAAAKIPENDARRTWYLEQAQEGAMSLGLVRGAKPEISLAPWTGPELPGALKTTAKYRLVVSGTPNAAVVLHADGMPKDWIASFCSDRICAPFDTTIRIPRDGVKIVELQIVPRGAGSASPRVSVHATSGGHAIGTVSTAIAAR